jgi:hypothetical protein
VRLFPAIDIQEGRAVRLRRGDFADATVFADDPVEQAREWERQGADALHVVDLDGARRGTLVNFALVRSIVDAVDIPVEYGGAVVVQPRRPLLEDRRHDCDASGPRRLPQALRRRSRHRLGEVEGRRVFLLTEVFGAEELREADQIRAGGSGLAHARRRAGQVLFRIGSAAHLDQADAEGPAFGRHTAADYLPEAAAPAGGSLLTNSPRSSRKTRSISVTARGTYSDFRYTHPVSR